MGGFSPTEPLGLAHFAMEKFLLIRLFSLAGLKILSLSSVCSTFTYGFLSLAYLRFVRIFKSLNLCVSSLLRNIHYYIYKYCLCLILSLFGVLCLDFPDHLFLNLSSILSMSFDSIFWFLDVFFSFISEFTNSPLISIILFFITQTSFCYLFNTLWSFLIIPCSSYIWASLVAQLVKNLPAMWQTWVQSLGWEGPLEKGKATHCSVVV